MIEKMLGEVAPQIMQLGAVGTLIMICLILLFKSSNREKCLLGKLIEVQNKRAEDSKEVLEKIGEVLGALKDEIKDLSSEIKIMKASRD